MNIKNKIKYLIMTTLIFSIIFSITTINSNATSKFKYEKINGVKYVNIFEWIKLDGGYILKTNHESFGEGYYAYTQGKLIAIYEKAPYIFINGQMTALKHETIKANNNEVFNFPLKEIPTKENNDFSLPVHVLENNLRLNNIKENKNEITTVKSGVSMNEFKRILPSMGFDSKGNYYDIDGTNCGRVRVVNYLGEETACFALIDSTPDYEKAVKNCIDLLLPNKGSELLDMIMSKSFKTQTFKINDRTVTLIKYNDGNAIEIK